MNYNIVNLTFKTYWRFKDFPYIQVTKCKKLINIKTNRLMTYNSRGFFVGGKYYKRNQINSLLEVIPKKEYTPF